ncbi:uncharacterized mitochondrial protein AtMg00810-like [Solanum verrucosum]|uniref:uncharacterized mitochondrial protein AtMg00810-like n=1 Tax=Solanum verrucosum TaxID=315347 RepID=UPI0020D0606A|nr:uncharacterized mitochondrial protein AtMg00810-like [Solanum verrucosum]
MNISEKLQQVNEEELTDARRFRSLVGGVIYLTHTRPDIAYPIGVFSWFMQQPSKVHYGATKRVLWYIAGTLNFSSCVVTWSSKKQATSSLSTLEAEYIATTSIACQAVWLRRVLANLQ